MRAIHIFTHVCGSEECYDNTYYGRWFRHDLLYNMLNCHLMYVTLCVSERAFVFMYLMCSQSTDSKNWWLLISSTLTAPTLFSASVQYLKHTNSWLVLKLSNKPLCANYLPSTPTCLSLKKRKLEWKCIFTYFNIKSLALSEMGTSGGKTRVSFQFITFLYVSCGVSEQKGG